MRNAPPYLMILLLNLVPMTHTRWQRAVCEDKYNVAWCLSSVRCINEFLNCNCVPRAAFVTQTEFPDTLSLCMLAYAYEVSEPKCCTSERKRAQLSRLSGDDVSRDDILLSLLLDTVQKRNFNDDVINDGRESNSASRRTDGLNNPDNKYISLKSGFNDIPDIKPVQKTLLTGTGGDFYSLLEKLVADSSNERINFDDTLDTVISNNANPHSKRKSSITRKNSKSRHKSRLVRSENAYRNSETQKSSVNNFVDVYQSWLLQKPAVVIGGTDLLRSDNSLSETDELSNDLSGSKLLQVLKCYVERD